MNQTLDNTMSPGQTPDDFSDKRLRDLINEKLGKFLHSDSAVGILLFFAAFVAVLMENSALSQIYHNIQHFVISLEVGSINFNYDLHYWVNDGLMALFFLMVGLEIKREFLSGHLANLNYVLLPAVAALGGIIFPALIFWYLNAGGEYIVGWAIPTATDIAFAMGLIAVFGKRLPSSIKLFVLTLAVIDDIGAILIIAVFYSESINLIMLTYAGLCVLSMASLNALNVRRLTPYMIIGLFTWVFMLKTGIHATLAGILIAACIPLRVKPNPRLPKAFGMDLGETRLGYVSPAIKLESSLHATVSFGVLPLFAFMNAGLNFADTIPAGSVISSMFTGITGGVFWGLFLGKPIGVILGAFLWKGLSRESFPSQIDYLNLLGMGFVCGIGFTMSILIGSIAYEGQEVWISNALFGILLGSLSSLLAAVIVFILWSKRHSKSLDDISTLTPQTSKN